MFLSGDCLWENVVYVARRPDGVTTSVRRLVGAGCGKPSVESSRGFYPAVDCHSLLMMKITIHLNREDYFMFGTNRNVCPLLDRDNGRINYED